MGLAIIWAIFYKLNWSHWPTSLLACLDTREFRPN
jgi:hypothetical protein